MKLSLSQIPNAICVLRIALIPPIVLALMRGDYPLALLLVMLAAFSDVLDGWLAKRFSWQTRIGGWLDPVADKLLLVTLFITLAWMGLSPVWLTAVVLGRDVVIVGGALAFNFLIAKVKAEPSTISKLNTLFQLIYCTLILASMAFRLPMDTALIMAGAAVLVTSVISGLDYVLIWSRRARLA
ncbi:MAG: CDP-alcohol phosphatidyltransferase family protein [Gammaproteobacteria bacterium]